MCNVSAGVGDADTPSTRPTNDLHQCAQLQSGGEYPPYVNECIANLTSGVHQFRKGIHPATEVKRLLDDICGYVNTVLRVGGSLNLKQMVQTEPCLWQREALAERDNGNWRVKPPFIYTTKMRLPQSHSVLAECPPSIRMHELG